MNNADILISHGWKGNGRVFTKNVDRCHCEISISDTLLVLIDTGKAMFHFRISLLPVEETISELAYEDFIGLLKAKIKRFKSSH